MTRGFGTARRVACFFAPHSLSCFLFACYFFGFALLEARPLSQYSQTIYRTEQGLPQNEVRSIAQTPDGYLWFATRDGLARFDGVRFVVFRKDNTPGIGHNMLGALLVDRAGRLWIATGDGLSCYEHGRFRRYTQMDGLPTNAIHSLFEDRAGKLWVGTWSGLAVFDGHRFRVYTTADGLPNNSISGIAADGDGGLWVGTYGGGVARLHGGGFQVLNHNDGLPSDVVYTILRDRAGRLWAGTLQGCALLGAGGKFHAIPELPGRTIYLFEDRSGDVWAASDKVFARMKEGDDGHFHKEQVPTPEVETLFEDREGTLWMGTTSGVVRCRAGAFLSYTTDEGLAANTAETVYEDSKGALWIGTSGGLNRWFAGRMTAEALSTPVHSVVEDGAGRIWAGTPKGVQIFDGKWWRQLPGLQTDVHVLYCDRAGRVWIGSPEGVAVHDGERTTKLTQANGLPGNYVMSIAEDRSGAVWLGTITGLARIDRGSVQAFGARDGLRSDYIQSLHEDGDGVLWVGTPGGLHRFQDGRFHAITEKDGLFADNTLRILEDGAGNFWFSSYRGVFRVAKAELNAFADGRSPLVHSVAYGTADGMKSVVFSGLGRQPAGWRAKDGVLWFPSEQGVVRVDPLHLGPPDPPPASVIETVQVDGVSTPEPRVGPGGRRLEFVFTAPTSIAPEATEFRYRMDGFENAWREAGTQRRISFTNLAPGRYRFVVSARRAGGEWGVGEAASALEIVPYFHQTRWFFAGVCVLGLLLLWSAHSMRVNQTERRLGAVMAERSRVAQELHDTLLQSLSGTAMQIQAALRRLRTGAAESGLDQLSDALVHLGKSMADARQAIHDLQTPELEELPLGEALRAVGQRVCGSGTTLQYRVLGTAKPLAPTLERHIYRIGAEAIANAVHHSGCSEVVVELHYSEEAIGLRVRDDGRGFDPLAASQTSTRERHWGLSGMRGRARQCGGQLAIQSTPEGGTQVEFEAPVA